MGESYVCVTGSKDRVEDTRVYGPFVNKGQAEEVAEELSADPEGDVEILPLDNSYAWWNIHKQGHPLIPGRMQGRNPACPFCRGQT